MAKLDFGCGKNKLPGFEGVDSIAFEGVDHVMDVRQTPWKWEDNSIDEAHSSHFVEHLDGPERVAFFNELYRVLKPGASVRIICPYWSHNRAYGDPTHKFPPISDWTFYYLNKGWRDMNAPHVGYTCDFEWVIAGTWDPNDTYVASRNQETKVTLMTRNINCTVDIVVTLTKRVTVDSTTPKPDSTSDNQKPQKQPRRKRPYTNRASNSKR